MKSAVYVCTSKGCRQRGQEFQAVTPTEARRATGRAVSCPSCGSAVFLRRIVDAEAKPFTADQRDGGARWEAWQNRGLDY